jgi:hypothetical protein
MQSNRQFVLIGSLLAFALALFSTNAPAATPDFTIAATSVTMSSSGSSGVGSSTFTLTSVNGYAGTIQVNCAPPTFLAGAMRPLCGDVGGPALPTYTLTANQVVTGTINLFNSYPPCSNGSPCPVSLPRRGGHRLAPGLVLAGGLLLGLGFRRRAARWLTLTLLAVGALAGLAGISACGGNNSVVTPGTYVYTVEATEFGTSATVTTSFNVTVP